MANSLNAIVCLFFFFNLVFANAREKKCSISTRKSDFVPCTIAIRVSQRRICSDGICCLENAGQPLSFAKRQSYCIVRRCILCIFICVHFKRTFFSLFFIRNIQTETQTHTQTHRRWCTLPCIRVDSRSRRRRNVNTLKRELNIQRKAENLSPMA